MEQVQTTCSKTDISEVWKKYKATGQRRYRDTLIKNYMPIVRIVAAKVKPTLPSCVEVDDLVTAGTFGLFRAIQLFDLKRGIKFETYCVNRIRGSMLDELREQDWVPRLVRTKEHKYDRAYYAMERRLGRPPSPYEVAKELNVSLNDFQNLEQEATVTNILLFHRDISNDNEKETELVNLIKDDSATENFRQMVLQDIVDYLKNSLSERERLVMQMYFYDNLTMKEISEVLDITESRVSQIYNSVITQLKRCYHRRQGEWLV